MVEPQQQVPVGRIVTDATLVYGEYINGQRALVADDRLQPVVRHLACDRDRCGLTWFASAEPEHPGYGAGTEAIDGYRIDRIERVR